MAQSRRRTHAWLAPHTGVSGEPYLPQLRQLYRVNTIVYSYGNDPAAARPAVVLYVAPDSASRSVIQLVTRTSKQVPGVPHPADKTLGCDRDGVFSDLVSVEQQLWTPQNVEPLGILPDPFWTQVLERFS
ncbi:MAG: hypothetical protein WBA97_22350 [Actinophytocola sp.]|uniref:hypothetical protein n=1 Tax=Actinophytocola sp. TaxID=1872138 RepID=UPI003C7263C8